MTDSDQQIIQNLNSPEVIELLNKFKNHHDLNVVDTAEIIAKLITTLKLDYDTGRPKLYTISGGHLGKILNIGKGVVSQYLSVWNMPSESKEFLKKYNLSLNNAYAVSRMRGRDELETISRQKDIILEKDMSSNIGSGQRIDHLLHSINETKMILNGIIISYKIPKNILKIIPIRDIINRDTIKEESKTYLYNIGQCLRFLSPKLSKLAYLKKELEFCNTMLEYNETQFCGKEINKDCLNKQIKFISDEIQLIESEQKLPHIASLLMMKNNLEKNI